MSAGRECCSGSAGVVRAECSSAGSAGERAAPRSGPRRTWTGGAICDFPDRPLARAEVQARDPDPPPAAGSAPGVGTVSGAPPYRLAHQCKECGAEISGRDGQPDSASLVLRRGSGGATWPAATKRIGRRVA